MLALAIEQAKKQEIANRITDTVQDFLDAPELEDLNEKQLTQITKALVVDKLKDSLKHEIEKAKLDVEKIKKRWLAQFESKHTQRSFRKNLDLFLQWLGDKSMLDVDARIADDYLIYLKSVKTSGVSSRGKRLSANTIRQRIAACSSFWDSMIRWKDVSLNPWHDIKLPKKKIAIKKSESVPTNKELDLIKDFCKRAMVASGTGSVLKKRGAIKAYVALEVLASTGLRVGALSSLTIDRKGYYTAESKGGTAQGRLTKKVLKTIKRYGLDERQPFKNYKSFAKWFERTCKELKLKISVHGLRHKFAVDYYNRTKDIAGLQRRLGHASLLATQAYLATLKSELND